jgi:hypothetical protein
MQFLVMVKAAEEFDAGDLPTREAADKMDAFNQTLVRDGIFLTAGGLEPASKGTRISYAGGKPTVTDGPFTETKEVIAGFWLLQARSKEEIIERLSRAPFELGEWIEIRQLYENC